MDRRLWTLLALLLVTGVLCGDVASAEPAARQDTPAGVAVRALTAAPSGVPARGPAGPAAPGSDAAGVGGNGAPDDGVDADGFPADFVAVMGYRPVWSGENWLAPHGACSAPTGSTRYGFGAACRAHDLGYDLLRYAARTGTPLGPWAREAIDDAFGRALDARCRLLGDSIGCRSAAATYHVVVEANSWRQDWRDPEPEPALPWIVLATALSLAPVALNGVLAVIDRVLKHQDP